ncbi:unnamed protein product [Prunus armeniaca]
MIVPVGEYWVVVMPKAPLINELPRPPDQAKQLHVVWKKPRHCFVKANCDGAWVAQTNMGGFGWVIHSRLDDASRSSRRYAVWVCSRR